MKKLRLNKETIAQLGNREMNQIEGGKWTADEDTCLPCHTLFCNSQNTVCYSECAMCNTKHNVASCLDDCDYTGGFDTSCLAC